MRGEVRAGHSRANATELGARPAYRIDLRILCETREADLPDLAIRLAPERSCGLAHCQHKHFALNPGAAGLVGPVAQWLEPAAHNGLVAGSSPARPTNKSMILLYFSFFDELPRACGAGAQECWSLGASYSALRGEIGTLSLAANFVFPRAAGKSRESDFGSKHLSSVRGGAVSDNATDRRSLADEFAAARSEGPALSLNIRLFLVGAKFAAIGAKASARSVGGGQMGRCRPRARH